MKMIDCLIFIFLIPSIALGSCNWGTIKKNTDKTYTISESLYICVGQLVEDSKIKTQQIADLTKAITLKDLSVQEADKKADLWNQAAIKLENRLQSVDSIEKKSDWLYFGLGMLATGFAAYTASKLAGH
jgi:hypothetical protein